MPLPTKILPKSLLDSVKRTRAVYQVGRKARFALGTRMGSRWVGALGSRAHYNDFMLTSTEPALIESYRNGAVEFVGILERALAEVGRTWADVDACLEVGCGYGRIVRELRHKLRPRTISVCDVIDEGARFTAAEFGVRRVSVVERLASEAENAFDLIYLLSVYTHLNRELIEANLAKVTSLLKPGGVLVFTMHGKHSAETAERYDQYWLDKAKLNATLDETGFFYERYPYYYAEYGLTWMISEEVRRLVADTAPDLDFVSYHPIAVDRHQDVFVYRKRSA
jgi:SAM-dependent methyltransferase